MTWYAVARAPLRVSLGGGGTDLGWYTAHRPGSALVITLTCGISVRVDQTGTADQDPGSSNAATAWTRRALVLLGAPASYQVRAISDVPGGSGLGSSGAYLVAIAAALAVLQGQPTDPQVLAERASAAEYDLSDGAAGPQDTWSSALGGLRRLTFHTSGSTSTGPDLGTPDTYAWLNERVVLIHSGISRSAAAELGRQQQRPESQRLLEMDEVRTLGDQIEASLSARDLDGFAAGLRRHHELKQQRTPMPPAAEAFARAAESAGALGTKNIGAGGGGALMFVCPPAARPSVVQALIAAGAQPLDATFGDTGVAASRWAVDGNA